MHSRSFRSGSTIRSRYCLCRSPTPPPSVRRWSTCADRRDDPSPESLCPSTAGGRSSRHSDIGVRTVGAGTVLVPGRNSALHHLPHLDDSEVLHTADRGRRAAPRRPVGLTPAHDQSTRRTPLPRNAGQPRSHVHKPARVGRHDHRGQPALTEPLADSQNRSISHQMG